MVEFVWDFLKYVAASFSFVFILWLFLSMSATDGNKSSFTEEPPLGDPEETD